MGWLAIRYGRHIIRAWSATLEKWSAPILWTFTVLTVAGLAFSIWKLRHSARREAASPGKPNVSEQPLPGKNYSQLT
jgi:hypothetical protein